MSPARETRVLSAGPVIGTLALPLADPPAGLVLLLPDTLGHDPRSAPYVDQLLRVGLAALDLLGGGDDAEAIARALPALREQAGIVGRPLGVIGFGAGAGVALRLGPDVAARVLLYPGCDGLAPVAAGAGAGAGAATLLLHGEADPANGRAACARLAARLATAGPVVHFAYPSAGYAWDYPAYGPERRTFLPRPDGQGRAASEPWPELAAMSASQAADFLATRLAGAVR